MEPAGEIHPCRQDPAADILLESYERPERIWIEIEISRADPVANHAKFGSSPMRSTVEWNAGPERCGVALTRLATDPYQSPSVKALQGGGCRLRVGDLRVLSIIENERLVVLVVGVENRREAYR